MIERIFTNNSFEVSTIMVYENIKNKLYIQKKRYLMAEKIQFKFTDSIWSELVLSVLLGVPLSFCATGLY